MGFRRGGTIDNIYVLNYIINRQISMKNKKLVVLFVDLKAAFDSVDRGILIEAMRKKRVKERLISRCEEILRESINIVKVEGKEGEKIFDNKKYKIRCPSLFTLLIADIKEKMEKKDGRE